MEDKCAVLKQSINGPGILVMPGVFDGFSARLVERMGFKAAFITGSGVAESTLGVPDVGIMGLAENVERSRRLAACCNLPLLADGDTGYGNAVNVYYAVKEFERSGVAGVMFEDQVWPKRCGHMAGKQLISAEEMVQKIKAAVAARENPSFVIKARTDAAGPLGIEEAIRRGNLYAEAGADLIFADAVLSVDDIARFARAVSAPVAVNMGFGVRRRATTPLLSPQQLQDLNVAVAIYPRMLTSAALRGMMNVLEAFQQSVTTGQVVERPDLVVSFEELHALMGLDTYRALEDRYLTEEQRRAKYGSVTRA